jgi:hypothetical protein
MFRGARGNGTSRRAVTATLIFFAFTTPFGIAAHLLSELAGLGWHDDADIIFSPKHAYLVILALISLGGLVTALTTLPRDVRRARVATLVDDLPFKGRGAGFTALSFVAQFGFFALTQIGEGCPLCSGDVFTGVLAAAAMLGALLVSLGKRRILEFALALVRYLTIVFVVDRAVVRALSDARKTVPSTRRRAPFAFRYRPPPHQAA